MEVFPISKLSFSPTPSHTHTNVFCPLKIKIHVCALIERGILLNLVSHTNLLNVKIELITFGGG